MNNIKRQPPEHKQMPVQRCTISNVYYTISYATHHKPHPSHCQNVTIITQSECNCPSHCQNVPLRQFNLRFFLGGSQHTVAMDDSCWICFNLCLISLCNLNLRTSLHLIFCTLTSSHRTIPRICMQRKVCKSRPR